MTIPCVQLATTGTPNGLPECPSPLIAWPQNTGVGGDYNIVLDDPLRVEWGLSASACDLFDAIGYN